MTTLDATSPAAVASVLLSRETVRSMCSYEQHLIGPKKISAVHNMRVYSRRLREVLSVFEEWLDPIAVQELRQYGRSVTKALGPVRNADVTIQFFRALRRDLHGDAQRRGIRWHIDSITDRRHEQREKMMAVIESLHLKRLSHDIDAFVEIPDIDDSNARPTLHDLAGPLLTERFDGAFSYEDVILDESKTEELHEMRIAFKKCRYALEIFEPAFDSTYRRILRRFKGYQDQLGDIHDLDIFISDLLQRIEQWREKDKKSELRTSLESVVKLLTAKRHDLYVAFCDYLREHDLHSVLGACQESIHADSTPE